jgi:putative CocE/NonD family hydrolase
VINPAYAGSRDNRKLEDRDDVLTFTSPAVREPLEVFGNPVIELIHHTDNPHADIFVRICEVKANGRSFNLSDGFHRLPSEKSSGTSLIRLDTMAHRFTTGTRIRVQISGGAHPRYARNLGTGENPATSTQLATSARTICHGDGGYSRLLLPCRPTTQDVSTRRSRSRRRSA